MKEKRNLKSPRTKYTNVFAKFIPKIRDNSEPNFLKKKKKFPATASLPPTHPHTTLYLLPFALPHTSRTPFFKQN